MARVQRATASFSATLTSEPSTGLFTAVDKEPDIRSPRVEDSENTNAYVPALRARRTVSRPLGCPPLKANFLKRSGTLAPWSEADQAASRKWSDPRLIAYVLPHSGTLRHAVRRRPHGGSPQESHIGSLR